MGARAVQERREGEAPSERFGPEFPGKYLSIASFKADGTAVATPVWFVQRDGELLVETDATSGKVKRIRRDPSVLIAPCSARGKLHDEPVPAHAELLPSSEVPVVEALVARKYRVDMAFLKPIRIVQAAMHPRRKAKPVVLSIKPV